MRLNNITGMMEFDFDFNAKFFIIPCKFSDLNRLSQSDLSHIMQDTTVH